MGEQKVLWSSGDGRFEVGLEARLASEEELQRAIQAMPHCLPTEALGLGPLTTLAVQLDEGSGPNDVLAVAPTGDLVIIELKRGVENSDIRRVVAQVLDYGSALWQSSYEQLEADCRLRHPLGISGSLAEHVRDNLASLGAPPEAFDEVQFRTGVETCLETGKFTFIVVARDFGVRPLRAMRYLVESYRVPCYAVEVGYFVLPGVPSKSIFIPTLAYSPSWLGADGQRGVDRTLDQLIADGPEQLRLAASLLAELANAQGLVVDDGRAQRCYRLRAALSASLLLYPSNGALILDLATPRKAGHEREADALLDTLSALSNERLAPSWPQLSVATLVSKWDQTRTILADYLDMMRSLLVVDRIVAGG